MSGGMGICAVCGSSLILCDEAGWQQWSHIFEPTDDHEPKASLWDIADALDDIDASSPDLINKKEK